MSSSVPNQIRGHILLSRWVGGPVHWLWWYDYNQINPIRIRWRSINRPLCCICPHLERGHLQTMHNISTQHDCMCRRQKVAFYGICPDSNKRRTCCLPYSIFMSSAQMLSALPKSDFQSADMKKAQISCFHIFLLQTNTCLEKTAEWNPLICLFRLNQIDPLFAPRVSWLLFTHVCWVTRRKYPGISLDIKKGKLADHQYIFWLQLTHDTQPLDAGIWMATVCPDWCKKRRSIDISSVFDTVFSKLMD